KNLDKAIAQRGFVGKKGPATPRAAFVAFFRVDEGADPLEYQQGIPQALRLMNSPLLTNSAQAVADAMKAGDTPAKVVEQLFLTALARPPSADELNRMVAHVERSTEARAAYGDILWALLNCSEFATNH